MNIKIVQSSDPVILVGGGALDQEVLSLVIKDAGVVVAADGGAARVLAAGRMPDAVYGDMDSLELHMQAQLAPGVLRHVAEQDSTDFDKCLRNIAAPLVLGYGFLGARVDHQLAAMNVLARRPDKPCILIGEDDVICHCPPRIVLNLPIGSRLSLFPFMAVTAQSQGLRWPLDGVSFAPGGVTGTSNEVSQASVALGMHGPGMLLILPVEGLEALVQALAQAPRWPARA